MNKLIIKNKDGVWLNKTFASVILAMLPVLIIIGVLWLIGEHEGVGVVISIFKVVGYSIAFIGTIVLLGWVFISAHVGVPNKQIADVSDVNETHHHMKDKKMDHQFDDWHSHDIRKTPCVAKIGEYSH